MEKITNIRQLLQGRKYFSRAKNVNFTFLKYDGTILSLGVSGKVEKVTTLSFNKLWMKDGIIED